MPALAEQAGHAYTVSSPSPNTRTNRSEMCPPQVLHSGIRVSGLPHGQTLAQSTRTACSDSGRGTALGIGCLRCL